MWAKLSLLRGLPELQFLRFHSPHLIQLQIHTTEKQHSILTAICTPTSRLSPQWHWKQVSTQRSGSSISQATTNHPSTQKVQKYSQHNNYASLQGWANGASEPIAVPCGQRTVTSNIEGPVWQNCELISYNSSSVRCCAKKPIKLEAHEQLK
jgi:hypothetical protein